MNIEALTLFNSNRKTKQHEGDDAGEDPARKQHVNNINSAAEPHSITSSKEKTQQRQITDSNLDRESAQVLTRQPMDRGELDTKLRDMLASSTSRLESSLQSTRDVSLAKPQNAPVSNSTSSAQADFGRRLPNNSSSTNVLRSAEMVQRHMMGVGPPTASHHHTLNSALALQTSEPAAAKPKSKQSVKYQVEMAYIRSTVAAGKPASSQNRTRTSTVPARSPLRPSSRIGNL